MSELDLTLQNIRSRVQRGGIDMMFSFRSYDNLRLGRVPINRVASILDTNGFNIPSHIIGELLNQYRHPKSPAEFDYVTFCQDMENIPTFHPTTRSVQLNSTATLKRFAQPQESLYICDSIRQELLRTRRNVDEFFKIHDKHMTGRCPIPKFGSALSSAGVSFSKNHLDILLNDFQVSETEVDYRTFLDIISRPLSDEELHSQPNAPRAAAPLSRTTALPGSIFNQPVAVRHDIMSVITKTHYLLKSARLQIEPSSNYFRDRDPLNKGVLPRPVFEGILCSVYRLALTKDEVEVLVSQYTVNPSGAPTDISWVDYKAFVEDASIAVQGGDVFNLEKCPTRNVSIDVPSWSPDMENMNGGAPAIGLEELLARLASVTYTRHVVLTEPFQDRDPYRRGCVNQRQFETVLALIPAHISADEKSLIFANYQKGSQGISYRDFLNDLQQFEHEHAQAHFNEVSRKTLAEQTGNGPSHNFSTTNNSYGNSNNANNNLPLSKRYVSTVGLQLPGQIFTDQHRNAAANY